MKIFPLLLGLLLQASPGFAQSLDPVRLERKKVAGVWANVVRVDLNDPRVCLSPVVADPGDYRTFKSLMNWGYRPGAPVERARLVAAINGTFFDTRSAIIICNLVARGRVVTEGTVGNTLVVDGNNRASLRPTAGAAGSRLNWSNTHFAVSAGPTLVRRGEESLDPYSEGFSDPGLFRRARRSALGITADNQLLMVSVNTPVSLERLAWMMIQLGSVEAINLDGGSSTGMYYRGRMLSTPKRLMTNLIVVHLRDEVPAVRDTASDAGPVARPAPEVAWPVLPVAAPAGREPDGALPTDPVLGSSEGTLPSDPVLESAPIDPAAPNWSR